MTSEEIERIDKRLEGFQGSINTLVGEVSALKTLVHSPAGCALAPKVRELELQNAKNKGVLVTIGFAATAIAATVSGIIVKVWK